MTMMMMMMMRDDECVSVMMMMMMSARVHISNEHAKSIPRSVVLQLLIYFGD